MFTKIKILAKSVTCCILVSLFNGGPYKIRNKSAKTSSKWAGESEVLPARALGNPYGKFRGVIWLYIGLKQLETELKLSMILSESDNCRQKTPF